MVLDFLYTLERALKDVEYEKRYHHFIIHDSEEKRELHNSDEIIDVYGDAKEEIVRLVNERFGSTFSHQNWLDFTTDDVAYFLNEVGSNSLNHSQLKAPHLFHLWLGPKGFVLGIEQKGEGFNAMQVEAQGIKENQGAAFTFFRTCKSKIFFDNAKDSKIVYMRYLFDDIHT